MLSVSRPPAVRRCALSAVRSSPPRTLLSAGEPRGEGRLPVRGPWPSVRSSSVRADGCAAAQLCPLCVRVRLERRPPCRPAVQSCPHTQPSGHSLGRPPRTAVRRPPPPLRRCGHTLLCPQHSSAGLGTAALHCTALAQRHWCRHRLTAPHSTTLHGTTKHTALSVSVPAVPADTAVCQECRCADGSAAQEDDWGFLET